MRSRPAIGSNGCGPPRRASCSRRVTLRILKRIGLGLAERHRSMDGADTIRFRVGVLLPQLNRNGAEHGSSALVALLRDRDVPDRRWDLLRPGPSAADPALLAASGHHRSGFVLIRNPMTPMMPAIPYAT